VPPSFSSVVSEFFREKKSVQKISCLRMMRRSYISNRRLISDGCEKIIIQQEILLLINW